MSHRSASLLMAHPVYELSGQVVVPRPTSGSPAIATWLTYRRRCIDNSCGVPIVRGTIGCLRKLFSWRVVVGIGFLLAR